MAIIKAVNSKASIGKVINYVTKDEKTEEKLISGIDCNPQTAIQEMQATKEIWDKTEGRQYKHFVHSFPPTDKITPEKAHELAKELCNERFKGHEVVVATHVDKDHIHSHIIVNSVNHENGYKLQQSKKDLELMKEHCNNLSREHGLSVPEKGQEITSFDMKKYKVLEKAITSNYDSYVHDCYKSVMEVKDNAINREDFIAKMKGKGYETNWTDNRKHITFTDISRQEQGEKKCKVRNTKLEKDYKDSFGKEDLERGFERNYETKRTIDKAREQLERAKEVNRGTGTNDKRAVVDNLNTSIRNANNAVSIDESQRNDRIAKEQSIEREQSRDRAEKSIRNKSKGFEIGD